MIEGIVIALLVLLCVGWAIKMDMEGAETMKPDWVEHWMDNIDIDEIINSNMTVTDHLLRDAIHNVVIDALSKADERIEELEKIIGDMVDQIIAYHEKQETELIVSKKEE